MEIPKITIEDDTHIYYDDGRIYSKTYNKFIGSKLKNEYIRSSKLGNFHRLIYEKFIGKIDRCSKCKIEKNLQIDHINDIRDDNRVINLQILCSSCNTHKQQTNIKNTSNIKGVCYLKTHNKWRAYIEINGKRHTKTFRFKYCAYICRKIWERKLAKGAE